MALIVQRGLVLSTAKSLAPRLQLPKSQWADRQLGRGKLIRMLVLGPIRPSGRRYGREIGQ